MKKVLRGLLRPERRQRVFIRAGIVIDLLWAAGNLALATTGNTAWFITLGCYYLFFAALRTLVLWRLQAKHAHGARKGDANVLTDCKAARACGIIILSSTFVLSGIATLVLHGDGVIRYDEISTIALATFTFCVLTSSIRGFVKTHGCNAMLVTASARTNMAIALVSLFTLEIAMISTFGTPQDAEFSFVMPIITGAVIACMLCYLGITTIVDANRKMRTLEGKATV